MWEEFKVVCMFMLYLQSESVDLPLIFYNTYIIWS